MVRVGFDIGGFVTKYPDIARRLACTIEVGGGVVVYVTDMPLEKARECLRLNGMLHCREVRSVDYAAHGESCKAKAIEELQLDVMIDDHMGYLMQASQDRPVVRLLVMPDASRGYYAPEWRLAKEDEAAAARLGWRKE